MSASNDMTSNSPRAVFLTGATGFLGAFILDELLRQTDATIYALVRAGDADDAARRLHQTFETFRIDPRLISGRTVPVPGDLTKPLLGLPEAMFTRLAKEVDTVYHSGANVNFTYPYSALKPANVDGTQEVVRLCVRERIKRLHYVSAVDALVKKGMVAVNEDDPLPERPLPHGYVQSKWAAERIVQAAADRGLPVTIYRPWLTGAHSQTGACHTTDQLLRILHACITIGAVPDYDEELNITPVDFFAYALVYISLTDHLQGTAYHLANPVSTPLPEIYSAVQDYGYRLDIVPWRTWHERLAAELPPTDAGYPVVPLIAEEPPGPDSKHPHIGISRTAAAMESTPFTCAPLDKRLVHLELNYLVDAGFLDLPDGARP